MRITTADKIAPTITGTGPSDANDGGVIPVAPLPAAADAGFAAKLLAVSQPAAESAGLNGAASYLQVPGQTDRSLSETEGTEQTQVAAAGSAEIVSDGQPASSEPVHSVRLQLSGENDQRVDVRLVEQGGSLALSVRSSDSALTRTLQDRLPELNDRLAEQHYQSEVWLPQAAANATAAGQGQQGQESGTGQHDSQHSGSNQSSSNQSGSNQSGSNQSGSNQSGSEDGKQAGSGSESGSAGQPDGRQSKAPKWYQRLTAFEDQSRS